MIKHIAPAPVRKHALARAMAPAMTTVSALVMAMALALPAQAEKLPLNTISGYLNTLKTAQAKFTQINGDGSISTGTLFIKRPGRARFEYNPPEQSLVLAGSGAVAVFDAGSNTGPATYPLNQTPLSIILAKDVNLGRARMVTGHTSDGTSTTITAQDPSHPEYGSIQLVFTGSPVELRQWVIKDNTGTRTTVILGEMRTGQTMSNSLFDIMRETEIRGPEGR